VCERCDADKKGLLRCVNDVAEDDEGSPIQQAATVEGKPLPYLQKTTATKHLALPPSPILLCWRES